MKHKTLIFIFLIFLISCSNTQNSKKSDWTILEIKEKNCEISFPFNTYVVHKEEYYRKITGKIYSYEVDLNTQKLDDENLGYKITIYDYPEFNFYETDSTIDEFLNGTAESLLMGFNATGSAYKKININGYPGKELIYYMASNGVYISTRMYIIDGKLYNLFVFTDKNKMYNKSITGFFNSFKIIDMP